MTDLVEVPIANIISLSAESAVKIVRQTLRAECRYARQSPAALTISGRITVADGGIDAEVNAEVNADEPNRVPVDCLFKVGLTGFQIKSGTTFRPWVKSAIEGELLDSKGHLYSEVERLVKRNGRYTVICTGHDLTPEQRNAARQRIQDVLESIGYEDYGDLIEVLGASQLAEYIERYPGIASLLTTDPIQEAFVFDEWQQDSHMANQLEPSEKQRESIEQIQTGLLGTAKHLRLLGEPGLGKTRIVLEALRHDCLSPITLYVQHGSSFGQTKLFRQLLKSPCDKPLILVLDELTESEMFGIWSHLKTRCGALKIVSIDHGRDESHDNEISRLYVPRLDDQAIKQILIGQVGDSRELDRWVEICEGSPRVAQAVAENLRANPEDLLRSPATVPLWDRFLHGYGKRDDLQARQMTCVAMHLALFSRFGYEPPVENEAGYIARVISAADPTIGIAQFQEIVKALRARRVLQGSRTLFFVPKALHIYLWTHFWHTYGAAFDFAKTFVEMPESLHVWFMNMFRFAGEGVASHVVDEILRPDGFYSDRTLLTSGKGARFLSTLAEASPAAVLRLLESSLGSWTDDELFSFGENRQHIVWTLEKIAVWPKTTARAMKLLARLAENENANNSNNATGTLAGLFSIGPEYAATEASPDQRLPVMQRLLRSSRDKEKLLALRCLETALDTRGMGYRIVGPEYQGLRERARLWAPQTYEEWGDAYRKYFSTLIDETRDWPDHLRPIVSRALLDAVDNQIKVPQCTEMALDVLRDLIHDPHLEPSAMNRLFSHWRDSKDDVQLQPILVRLNALSRAYAQRDLKSRVQKYVIDVDWLTWDEERRERRGKRRSRAKDLVNALAKRIVSDPKNIGMALPLLTPTNGSPAIGLFGEQLARHDLPRALLPELIKLSVEKQNWGCLNGYLNQIRTDSLQDYRDVVSGLLKTPETAWLGATVALQSAYEENLADLCMDALEAGWVPANVFKTLLWGDRLKTMPKDRKERLIGWLYRKGDIDSFSVLIDLFRDLPFDETAPVSPKVVFDVVAKSIPGGEGKPEIRGYGWKDVCEKLVKWDGGYAMPLLDSLLEAMRTTYRLSYDTYVGSMAFELAQADPAGAWTVIQRHLESSLPKWRSDVLSWLQGDRIRAFDDADVVGPIVFISIESICKWIDEDRHGRAGYIAHAAPKSLDDDAGGKLTRLLLKKYSDVDGVVSGISAIFHSGGWSGLASLHYKKQRDKFRRWLALGFEPPVVQWIEAQLEYFDRLIVAEEIQEERERFE